MLFSSCSKEEKVTKNDFGEDIRLQAFKELIKTGSTNKVDVRHFHLYEGNIQQTEAGLRSDGPQSFGYAFNELSVSSTPECCSIEFLGYSQHNWWEEEFLITTLDLGIEEDDYEQWVHWDVDEVDSGLNFERHEFDGYRPSYGTFFDAVCNPTFDYGSGIWWPAGGIQRGLYRFRVEKGYTAANGDLIVCSTDEGYAEYGCGELIACQ